MQDVHEAYARLREDAVAWEDYLGELAEWDTTTADGLPDACSEYPEYNR